MSARASLGLILLFLFCGTPASAAPGGKSECRSRKVRFQAKSGEVIRAEVVCQEAETGVIFSESCSKKASCDAAKKGLRLDSNRFHPRGDFGSPDFSLCEAAGMKGERVELEEGGIARFESVVRCVSPVDGSFVSVDWVAQRLKPRKPPSRVDGSEP